MLVLSRKPNETIRIGDDVSVTIVSVDGNNVKLGIEAPYRVSVHRGEIYERIQRENRLAASGSPTMLSQIARRLRREKQPPPDSPQTEAGGTAV